MTSSCPVCGRINTHESGVPFPSESTRFVRYCLQLQVSPKGVDKKALICYDHFDPKDHVKENGKTIGVTRLALPKKVSLFQY